MLPSYYRHIKKYRASLLAKFYGLHLIRSDRGLKVVELAFTSKYYVNMLGNSLTDMLFHLYAFWISGIIRLRVQNKVLVQQMLAGSEIF